MKFECENCEDGIQYTEKELSIDSGNNAYECPICGGQLFERHLPTRFVVDTL